MNCSINCLTFVPQAFLSVFISLHVCSDLDPIKIQVDEDSVNIVKIQNLVEFGQAFSLKKTSIWVPLFLIHPVLFSINVHNCKPFSAHKIAHNLDFELKKDDQ